MCPGQRTIQGTRKLPSKVVPLVALKRRHAAVGPGEDFGAVVRGEDDYRVVSLADVIDVFEEARRC